MNHYFTCNLVTSFKVPLQNKFDKSETWKIKPKLGNKSGLTRERLQQCHGDKIDVNKGGKSELSVRTIIFISYSVKINIIADESHCAGYKLQLSVLFTLVLCP